MFFKGLLVNSGAKPGICFIYYLGKKMYYSALNVSITEVRRSFRTQARLEVACVCCRSIKGPIKWPLLHSWSDFTLSDLQHKLNPQ